MNRHEILAVVRDNPQVAERAREQMNGVLARSATDVEFRSLLLTDSRAALSQHFGRELPADASVAFVESTPGTATVVLPDAIDTTGELSEAEMEAVSGGSTGAEIALVAAVIVISYMIGDALN